MDAVIYRYLSIILVILITLNQAQAMDKPPAQIDNAIQELLCQYGIPGASITVTRHGKILWTKSYGYADLNTKRKVTDKTLFQAASITKTLTSVAVLKVVTDNKISLDDPVNNYLKRWKIPNNHFTEGHPVTIRMLLNHTAGISNPYPEGGYPYYSKLPTLVQLFKGRPPATNPPLEVTYMPGSKYHYCNGCYSILQMFLEDVTGKPYPTLMQELVLSPASMSDSLFDNNFFLKFPDRVALPYDQHCRKFKKAPMILPIYSTGLLWTTSSDLSKFIISVQQGLIAPNNLISTKLAKLMVTPSSTPTRGLGFFISDKKIDEKQGGHYFMHTGNNIGYLTLLIGSLDGENGAAILINISPKWNAKNFPQFGFIKNVLCVIAQYYHWS